jgi:hypothetical protein
MTGLKVAKRAVLPLESVSVSPDVGFGFCIPEDAVTVLV